MLFSLQVMLSPFLVVSESITTINIVTSALIRKVVLTMFFPLRYLLMIFSLQIVSKSMSMIYIVPTALIRYSRFMTLMGNTIPREFITTIIPHRSDHQYIATRSIQNGNQGTIPFGSRATLG